MRPTPQKVDRMRRQQGERARYEAELAERRYLRVDSDNRWWLTLWRRSGTTSCARLPRRRKIANVCAPAASVCSAQSNVWQELGAG